MSKNEFFVLELCWEEVRYFVAEFLRFCHRTFGDDLERTWNALNEGDGGSRDAQAWATALSRIGYRGPSRPTFSLLDTHGEDSWTGGLEAFLTAFAPFQA